MQQKIKTFHGIDNIESQMNDYLTMMNNQGWVLSKISCFYSRQSNYILVFEKEEEKEKDNAK